MKVGVAHKSMTHRCNACPGKPMFSVKTGTVMEGSKLGYRIWAIGIYLFTTHLKGVSSMKLHRDLGIGQKAAWFLLQRLRKAYEAETGAFAGPVEIDQTYIGGKRKNMPKFRRKQLAGRGAVGKIAVVGAKDRRTDAVAAAVVANADKDTLQAFVFGHAVPGATVYTDDAKVYKGLVGYDHEAVNHSVGEYVRASVHTNGIESFWAMLKRALLGTYHKISAKHIHRYVMEFVGRHNDRNADTIDQMANIAGGMVGKRLRYDDLIADRECAPSNLHC